MAAAVVLTFLIALYPGFIIGKTTPHPNPLPILGGGSYSCKGTTSGRGGGTTTSIGVCPG
jgi:hypothetical protein